MTALVRSLLSPSIRLNGKILYTFIRGGAWHSDWKPGPYPETPEAIKEAAEKYNLPVELYQPYPNDGTGLGDYPKLPDVSEESKDLYYPYDCPEYRRNFNEPMHYLHFVYAEDRYNVNQDATDPVPSNIQLKYFFGAIAFFCTLFWIGEQEYFQLSNPWMARQYPQEGVVHYTFELEDE